MMESEATPVVPFLTRKIHSVQILRGIAALLVVIAHIIEHPQVQAPTYTYRTGRLGVDIFFVISGIIISEVSGRGRFDPVKFIIHRFFRLVPLYWIVTLLVAGSVYIWPQTYKTTVFDGGALIKALLFIPAADPTNPNDWRPIFKIGWTLNYEMFFYAVCVSLFWCRTSLQRTLGLSVILGTLVVGSAFMPEQKSLAGYYVNLKLLPFLAGVWLNEFRRRGLWDRVPITVVACLGALTVIMLVWFYSMTADDLSKFAPQGTMTCTAGLLLAFGLTLERRVNWNTFRQLEATGDDSYSLYLLHMFIVGAIAALLHKLGVGGLAFWAGMALGFPISLGAARFSFQWLERPINVFGKSLGDRNATGFARDAAKDPPAVKAS